MKEHSVHFNAMQYVMARHGRHGRTIAAGGVHHDDLQDLVGAAHAQVEGLAPVRVRRALLPARACALRPSIHRTAAHKQTR